MSCVCGRTTLMPPIPCGTQIHCNHPCNRPPPPCGHPKPVHSCHETEGCPPCPFLTAKICACGKMTLPNVRCSQPKVSCGTSCGKLLPCGFHACQRMCHGDDCGPCESVCGKDRKLWYVSDIKLLREAEKTLSSLPDHHGCILPCHAPSACPEFDPCQSIVTLECTCGRIKRQVSCGRSLATPGGRATTLQPKCTSECQIAQRNARLAEALGIEPGSQARSERTMATYNPELVAFTKANHSFVKMVEAALAEYAQPENAHCAVLTNLRRFVSSERRTHALPHMPEAKRSFVYNVSLISAINLALNLTQISCVKFTVLIVAWWM
jgi:transcriptional repressor NF-X1